MVIFKAFPIRVFVNFHDAVTSDSVNCNFQIYDNDLSTFGNWAIAGARVYHWPFVARLCIENLRMCPSERVTPFTMNATPPCWRRIREENDKLCRKRIIGCQDGKIGRRWVSWSTRSWILDSVPTNPRDFKFSLLNFTCLRTYSIYVH